MNLSLASLRRYAASLCESYSLQVEAFPHLAFESWLSLDAKLDGIQALLRLGDSDSITEPSSMLSVIDDCRSHLHKLCSSAVAGSAEGLGTRLQIPVAEGV